MSLFYIRENIVKRTAKFIAAIQAAKAAGIKREQYPNRKGVGVRVYLTVHMGKNE